MADVEIRRYRKADLQAVLRITEESFEGFCLDNNMEKLFGLMGNTTWQERKCEGIEYDLKRSAEHTFVAEVDGEVVGYVSNRVYPEHSTGHIANMAVAKDCQSRGIGKMLIRAALDHFRDCGLHYARIETLEQNYKGQKLYPSFGFKEIGRQIFYLREL
jgi:ribosomal protein S18 acetylase RimI-like enzyme